MGGAVSSGRDNNELVDNLMSGGYIRNPYVERVFRVLNRADYMTPLDRNQAYKDLAWRSGALHLSAPCIYSEVMEALELRPGQAFLNVGSGTGYLSTLAGLILGTSGISHGIEIHPGVVEYSTKKLSQFQENSVTLDEFDFCIPKYYCGNALCLAPLQTPYDRVYVGAGVLNKYDTYFKHMIKVGGILVMPLDDALVQIKRVSETVWNTRQLLNVSFALLRPPTKEETAEPMRLDDLIPVSLMLLSRAAIRRAMLVGVCRRHPELKEPPSRRAVAVRPRSRHICIPLDNDSDEASLNELHNLNEQEGAREMNALLSLVLTMGTNRIAGSLNFGEDQERDFGTGANDELEVMMEAPITESSSSSEEDSYPPRPRAAFRPSVAGAANVCSMDERVDRYVSRRTRSTVWTPLVREPGDSDFNTLTPAGRVEVERRARFSKPSLTPDRGDDTGSTSSDSDSSKPATSGESLGAGRSVASLDHPIGWGPKPATSGESHGEGGSAPSSGTKRSGGAGGGGGGGSGGGGGGKVSGCHVRRRYRAAPGSRLRRARANLRRSKRYPPELQMYFGNAGVYSQTDVVHSSPEGVSASVSDTHTRDPPSSDDEPLSTTQEKKRQKLDSGIGEGTATATATASASASASTSTSASAGSSSQTTPEESSYTDASTTDNQNPAASGRRRGSRRGYESGAEGARPAAVARRVRRHARDARRVRLSIVMKRAVKELPLPRPLKKFVNLYRCYEF